MGPTKASGPGAVHNTTPFVTGGGMASPDPTTDLAHKIFSGSTSSPSTLKKHTFDPAAKPPEKMNFLKNFFLSFQPRSKFEEDFNSLKQGIETLPSAAARPTIENFKKRINEIEKKLGFFDSKSKSEISSIKKMLTEKEKMCDEELILAGDKILNEVVKIKELLANQDGEPIENLLALQQELVFIKDNLSGQLFDCSNEVEKRELKENFKTVEKALQEIERRQEVLFKAKLEMSAPDVKNMFVKMERLAGEKAIPIDNKLAFFSVLEMGKKEQKMMTELLDLAIKEKKENQRKILRGQIPKKRDDIVVKFQKILSVLLDKNCESTAYSLKGWPLFISAISGMAINTQCVADSIGSRDEEGEGSRYDKSIQSRNVLALEGLLTREESNLAEEGYLYLPGYNIFVRNEALLPC